MEKLIPENILIKQIVGVSPTTWWTWRRTRRLDGLPAIIIGGGRGRRYYRAEDVSRWLSELAGGRPA